MNELRKVFVVLLGGVYEPAILAVTEIEELADDIVLANSGPPPYNAWKETHTLLTRKSADMLGVS